MSNFESEVKKLEYAFCDKEDHTSEPLSRICLDQKCNNKTLVCALCQEFSHKNHETLPLKTYLTKAYEQPAKKSQVEASPLLFTNKIDMIRENFFTIISDYRTEVLDLLNTVETQGKIFFNQIHQEVISLVNLQKPLEIIKRETKNQTKLKEFFRQMTKMVPISGGQKFSLSKKLETVFSNCEDKQRRLQDSLDKSKKELQASLVRLSTLLNPQLAFAVKPPTFKWSETLKGHKIKINGTIAEQSAMQSSGQRFIMIQPSVSALGNTRKMRWGIRIIKFVGWVGIGICLRNAITKANYHFNYNNIGHGSYLISSNGYSWSHSVKEFNSAFKTFQFAVNDIVYIEYDPIDLKLRFRKNEGGEVFALSIVQPPPDDEYFPCANICSTGDSVELINPGRELS